LAITLTKSVNFGTNKKNLSTVGYRLLNINGTLSGSRITSGVGEIYSDSGIYSASIYFSANFSGSILWDTGGSSPVFASEEYNGTEYDISLTRKFTTGRWLIDGSTKEMIFYEDDNVTEIARFDLKDSDGNPNVETVFDRRRQ